MKIVYLCMFLSGCSKMKLNTNKAMGNFKYLKEPSIK